MLRRVDVIRAHSRPAVSAAKTDRVAANIAIATLIEIAKRDIVATHRGNRVGFTIPLNPVLNTSHFIDLRTPAVTASGKVFSVRHVMDVDAGRAVSEVTLAISSLAGVGIDHIDTPVTITDPALDPVPYGAPPIIQYDSMFGDESFRVTFPAISGSQRNNDLVNIKSLFSVAIAENTFIVST